MELTPQESVCFTAVQALTVDGQEPPHKAVAAEMGLSVARVSKLRKQIREKAAADDGPGVVDQVWNDRGREPLAIVQGGQPPGAANAADEPEAAISGLEQVTEMAQRLFPKEEFGIALTVDSGREFLVMSKLQVARLPIAAGGLPLGIAVRRLGNSLIAQGRPTP